jgi:hypothetical protein
MPLAIGGPIAAEAAEPGSGRAEADEVTLLVASTTPDSITLQ